MGKTSIEWTDFSVNPFRARDKKTGAVGHFCVKVSPGCKVCYASALQKRFRMHEFIARNRDKVALFLDESKLEDVLRRKKPTKYFWCDMTDMFLEDYPDAWIDRCFAVMALTPQHTHQVLTKRQERLKSYASDPDTRRRIAIAFLDLVKQLPDGPLPLEHRSDSTEEDPRFWAIWPLPNVWLGVSVENQHYADERIPQLLETPAAVRFISYEPALGPIQIPYFLRTVSTAYGHLSPLDLLIAGGESGPHARPAHPQWFRDVRDQCQAAGVPLFFKQRGAWSWDEQGGGKIKPTHMICQHGTVSEAAPWACDEEDHGGPCAIYAIANVGKHAAGAMLDGRKWQEFPASKRRAG